MTRFKKDPTNSEIEEIARKITGINEDADGNVESLEPGITDVVMMNRIAPILQNTNRSTREKIITEINSLSSKDRSMFNGIDDISKEALRKEWKDRTDSALKAINPKKTEYSGQALSEGIKWFNEVFTDLGIIEVIPEVENFLKNLLQLLIR